MRDRQPTPPRLPRSQPSPPGPAPAWNDETGELWLGDQRLAAWTPKATAVRWLLNQLQRAGWPPRSRPVARTTPSRLRNAIQQLRRREVRRFLLVEGDGQGGVQWRLGPEAGEK